MPRNSATPQARTSNKFSGSGVAELQGSSGPQRPAQSAAPQLRRPARPTNILGVELRSCVAELRSCVAEVRRCVAE
eukprot:14311020-Alexandrium_andersonii.AAC.1